MSDEDIRLTKELGFEDILGMPFDKEKALEQQGIIAREETLTNEEKKVRKIEALVNEEFNEALKLFDSSLTKKNSTVRIQTQILLAEIWLGIST